MNTAFSIPSIRATRSLNSPILLSMFLAQIANILPQPGEQACDERAQRNETGKRHVHASILLPINDPAGQDSTRPGTLDGHETARFARIWGTRSADLRTQAEREEDP